VKTVHEYFTNKRMADSRFEHSWSHSWMVVHVAGVVARAVVELSRDIESLRGRMGESMRQVEGLFESLLAESFG